MKALHVLFEEGAPLHIRGKGATVDMIVKEITGKPGAFGATIDVKGIKGMGYFYIDPNDRDDYQLLPGFQMALLYSNSNKKHIRATFNFDDDYDLIFNSNKPGRSKTSKSI